MYNDSIINIETLKFQNCLITDMRHCRVHVAITACPRLHRHMHRAVPVRHQFAKIACVSTSKTVPCRARVSGAAPIWTRFLKACWPGLAPAQNPFVCSVNAIPCWAHGPESQVFY